MLSNFFRRLFAINKTKNFSNPRKDIFHRLELLGLEERITPTTFTVINNSDSGGGFS